MISESVVEDSQETFTEDEVVLVSLSLVGIKGAPT